MPRLHINIDHVATLRQARRSQEPDPVTAAAICELAGADGITVHLREDRRHIQDRDVHILRKTVKTLLNLEMAAGCSELVALHDMEARIREAGFTPRQRNQRYDIIDSREAIPLAVPSGR